MFESNSLDIPHPTQKPPCRLCTPGSGIPSSINALQRGRTGTGEEVTAVFGYLMQGTLSGLVLLSHVKAINHAVSAPAGGTDSWSSRGTRLVGKGNIAT